MTMLSCGVVVLLAAVCASKLSLVAPAAAALGKIRSDHLDSQYPTPPMFLDKFKTLVVVAVGKQQPVPLTLDNLLQQPVMGGLLQPDTYSLQQPDTDSLQQPEIDVLLKRGSNGLLEWGPDGPLELDTEGLLERDTDSLLEPHIRGLTETVADGSLRTDSGVLLRNDVAAIRRVMVACHRVLQYFRRHLTQLNFDAVLGTRIAEAQFRMTLKALEEESVLPGARAGLQALLEEAEDLNNVAATFIKLADPAYYHGLGALLGAGFWEAPLTPASLNTSRTLFPPHDTRPVLSGEEQLEEGQSDECLVEELGGGRGADVPGPGAAEEGGGGGGRCGVGRDCWRRMTAPGYSGYSLTHQVFFLIIGVQAGCYRQLEQLLLAAATGSCSGSSSLEDLLGQLCSAVLLEAAAIAQAAFPEHRRDLFMEQGALCGLLGYSDFFRQEWLARVLSWQRDPGCYGDALVYPGHHPEPLGYHHRVRREERVLSGRCLAHRSSVALGYLSLYLRFLCLL